MRKTDYKGVSFYKSHQKWVARITIKGEEKFLGYFDSAVEAHSKYLEAASQYHTHNRAFNGFARLADLEREVRNKDERIKQLEAEIERLSLDLQFKRQGE